MSEYNDLQKIILPTRDLINNFRVEISGALNEHDLNELVAQIIHFLLNKDNVDVFLVDYSRLINKFNNSESYKDFLNLQTNALMQGIDVLVKQYALYVDNEFPYFFWKLHGNDIILVRLPY